MATHREELEIEKIRTDIEEIRTNINKMIAETAKINSENTYLPIVWIAGTSSTLTLALVAIVKLFL